MKNSESALLPESDPRSQTPQSSEPSKAKFSDRAMKYVFLACSVFSIIAVVSIVGYLLFASIPAFREIGVFRFIFGMTWAPVQNSYGIFPMIVGSIYATVGAILIGGTVGVFGAIYLAKFCPKRLKGILTQLVSVLAGIPSIIYGLFGMILLVPTLAKISPSGSGSGLLAASLILAIMILPTVVSISKTNIEAVPESYYDGAVALGCTHAQAVFKTVVPAAKSGIFTALILGVGRAIGETMAVIMVIGNAPFIPTGLFDNFRTLTVNIVLEMGYASGLHHTALVATGFVLLVFVLCINLSFNLFKSKGKRRERVYALEDRDGVVRAKSVLLVKESKNKSGESLAREAMAASGVVLGKAHRNKKLVLVRKKKDKVYVFENKPVYCRTLEIVSNVLFYIAIAALALIIGFVLVKGFPNLNVKFLFGPSGNGKDSLAPAFVSTFWLILLTLVISVPIGVFAAVFLVEYTKKKSKLVSVIRMFTETLAGIPSIVFGLFGMIVFCEAFGMRQSLISGALTLSLIVLPTIVRSTEEALMSVPDSLREGSLALGASKVRTIFKVVLPCAISGIMTSVVLSVGRIVGESAALIYTAGAVKYMPNTPFDQGASFSVMMWMYMGEGGDIGFAYATAVILMIIVVGLNLISYFLEKKFKKKY